MLNEEPAQSQDLQMMGMLLPLGIEKGKDFKPDVATVARLNSAAAEAHAWLLAQIPTFVADWWPGRRQAAGEFADRRVLPFHAVPTFGLSSYDNDCDLGRDRVLASKNDQAQAPSRWDAIICLVARAVPPYHCDPWPR